MLVYSDAQRSDDPREKSARVRAGLLRLTLPRPGIERHALLGEMLVEAGELEQGLSDSRLARDGEERPSPVRRSAARLTRSVAEALLLSFHGRSFDTVSIERALADLLALDLPERIEISVPEGYAFYGLYPETYFCAAEAALGTVGKSLLKVLGIRSIGTGLAAAVAAVLGNQAQVVGVRPTG